jgi:hypothetical protein
VCEEQEAKTFRLEFAVAMVYVDIRNEHCLLKFLDCGPTVAPAPTHFRLRDRNRAKQDLAAVNEILQCEPCKPGIPGPESGI